MPNEIVLYETLPKIRNPQTDRSLYDKDVLCPKCKKLQVAFNFYSFSKPRKKYHSKLLKKCTNCNLEILLKRSETKREKNRKLLNRYLQNAINF